MKTFVPVLFLLLWTIAPVWGAEKDAAVSQHLAILQQLQNLARENRDAEPRPALCEAIDRLLNESLSPVQLYRLGVSASLIAYPQEAGPDTAYDNAFGYACRRCAWLLSRRVDEDSVACLQQMKLFCGQDGGESLMFTELVNHQQGLVKAARAR